MDTFGTLKQMLNALLEAHGLDRAVIAVDMFKRLNEVEKDYKDLVRHCEDLQAECAKLSETLNPAEDSDGTETIAGKTYKYGEVK